MALLHSGLAFVFILTRGSLKYVISTGSGAHRPCPPALVHGLLSCFSVDEYIAIAKEKHGYNMEQVTVGFCCCSKWVS